MTGSAGGLGKEMRWRLLANCKTLRLSDIVDFGPAQAGEEVMLADMADAGAVLKLLDGVDAVVHFGGISVEQPFHKILGPNIVGVYNLYEAARKKGVKRIVFASSNHVTGFYRTDEVISPEMPVRPDSYYGLSKAFGENLARFYFDRYGIETACLRIGSSFPEPKDRRMLATWMSYDDLHRMIMACLETPVLGFTVVYGISDNSAKWWDNTGASHIGFRALDSVDRFKEAMFARTETPDPKSPAVIFQGGKFCSEGPFED
ncbi:MAG TPA: NAD(P)-dependent oxidoreductase [Burkholderiales bacterium]|nr:NAD(P)-dependent oxidoreductase [Burkholderiales bacterium]